MAIKQFTFIVLTYNHEKFILEYLESVKYQIIEYGKDIQIQLFICDDCSSDNTLFLISNWCEKNRSLFSDIQYILNKNNIGTCNNFTNVWPNIKTEFFHFCAGDDLYSFENIFDLASYTNEYDIVSYIPLHLMNGIINKDNTSIIGVVSSNIIYKSFSSRVRNIYYLFAPCLFYNSKIIRNKNISNYVKQFKVVEDLPFQIKTAEEYIDLKFEQKYYIPIYYRRTTNSTYIIRNDDFTSDKIKAFEYLLQKETNLIKKVLIKNRIYCIKTKSNISRKIFNLNYYIYLLKCLFNLLPILKQYSNIMIDLEKHRRFYHYIKINACEHKLN